MNGSFCVPSILAMLFFVPLSCGDGSTFKVIRDPSFKLVSFLQESSTCLEECALLCLNYEECISLKYEVSDKLCSLVKAGGVPGSALSTPADSESTPEPTETLRVIFLVKYPLLRQVLK